MNQYFNENTVLDYVKQSLGAPYNIIEFDDDYLIDRIILNHNYLKEFSQYFPKEERIYLTSENNESVINRRLKEKNPEKFTNLQVNEYENNRWVLDTENEILGVKNILSTSVNTIHSFYSDAFIYSNPIESSTNNLVRSMADIKISYKFYYPNIVEVKGYPRNLNMLAILDVVHDKDLSSIPSTLHHPFNRFCLYNTANALLHIRNKYSDIETPFGSININIDFLREMAEKKNELIQEFKSAANLTSRGLGIFVL